MALGSKIANDAKIHFVGVGGIGMSALAQLFNACGCEVSGSDRGAECPANQAIIAPLKAQGIKIYPQDGSFAKEFKPDFLIYSTAVEEGNPDFIAAPDVPRLHRAEALAEAIALNKDKVSIAVTGSCGKTTVTAWLAEALYNLGADPSYLNGGLLNTFRKPDCAGNYQHGQGKYFVFEADESDKSLLVYQADYAIILNMGTDHYSKEELIEVFSTFAANTKKGLVLKQEVYELIKSRLPRNLPVAIFDKEISDYETVNGSARIKIKDTLVNLPVFGKHNALNAAAVLSMLEELGFDRNPAKKAVENFNGVWRRFDLAGKNKNETAVYDDYAHNPEKIASCIRAAKEMTKGRIFAVFQPHGFKPFNFMRDALLEELEKTLGPDDEFILLPPFYAGGTSSFKPSSEEVAASYQKLGSKKYSCSKDRTELSTYLDKNTSKDDIILIMGARDNSLSDYAIELATHKAEV
jgi:UDP-N-acetylmuramate--alanine ligase